MKCASCNTSMQLSKAESSTISAAEWYRCPCCGRSRLTAHRREFSESILSSTAGKTKPFSVSKKLSEFVQP